jgi:hypothetical protein
MKKRNKLKNEDSVLSQIVKENGVEKLYNLWQQLLNGEKSKYDSKGAKPIINRKAWVHRDQDDKQNRHCWICNKSLYGQNLKYNGKTKSIPVYHLALLSKLKTYELFVIKFINEDDKKKKIKWQKKLDRLKRRINKLSVIKYHITHTCGHGRKEGSKNFTEVCMNPNHLRIRSKTYNEEQTHCHFFLHNKDITLREGFIKSNLCRHKPKCF